MLGDGGHAGPVIEDVGYAVAAELALDGSSDTADFTVSRFLLKPGRTCAASVETFFPYTGLKEPNEEARTAAQNPSCMSGLLSWDRPVRGSNQPTGSLSAET